MATQHWRCGDEVQKIAGDIIAKHHPHLKDANVLLLFREKASRSKGRYVAGTATKASAKDNAIAGVAGDASFAFVIVLANDIWENAPHKVRVALIDHELCHCAGSAAEGWDMRCHEVEEFSEIVERHGLWNRDLHQFVKRVVQLDLFAKDGGGDADLIDFSAIDTDTDTDTDDDEVEAAA